MSVRLKRHSITVHGATAKRGSANTPKRWKPRRPHNVWRSNHAPLFVRHASPGDAFRASAQSAPQVTSNGFLVKLEVSVNTPAAKVYDALVGQIGSWSDRSTPTQVMRRISRSTHARAAASAKNSPMAAELNTLGSSTLFRVKSCGSQERSDRCRRPGVAGTLTWKLTSGTRASTRRHLSYSVGGFIDGGFDKIAPAVEGVLREQLDRLKQFAETGKPTKA